MGKRLSFRVECQYKGRLPTAAHLDVREQVDDERSRDRARAQAGTVRGEQYHVIRGAVLQRRDEDAVRRVAAEFLTRLLIMTLKNGHL